MKTILLSLLFLFPVIFIGCEQRDEKSVNLGQHFVLIRLHGNVSVEDVSTPENIGIPPEVISLGYNEKFVIAYSVTNRLTNAWVIVKDTKAIVGPLTDKQFDNFLSTNKELNSIKQKDVWAY